MIRGGVSESINMVGFCVSNYKVSYAYKY